MLLVKPLTFMNRSGVAVERLLMDTAARRGDLVVVVDDVALPLGEIRVRERGSHGGHNGLRSLIEVLATEEFPRVRLGIRRAEAPDGPGGVRVVGLPAGGRAGRAGGGGLGGRRGDVPADGRAGRGHEPLQRTAKGVRMESTVDS